MRNSRIFYKKKKFDCDCCILNVNVAQNNQ
jgi:hypothetical protein